MNPTRTTSSPAAAGKREACGAFAGKQPLIERLSDAELQRCLYNEYEMGSAQPAPARGHIDFPEQNFDHHLF